MAAILSSDCVVSSTLFTVVVGGKIAYAAYGIAYDMRCDWQLAIGVVFLLTSFSVNRQITHIPSHSVADSLF